MARKGDCGRGTPRVGSKGDTKPSGGSRPRGGSSRGTGRKRK